MISRTQQRAAIAAIVTAAIAAAYLWHTWPEIPAADRAEEAVRSPAPALSSLGARLRLISRLARTNRMAAARKEAAALLAAAPGLSVRRWVQDTYTGVKRPEDLEAEISLLTGLGLPEHEPMKPDPSARRK